MLQRSRKSFLALLVIGPLQRQVSMIILDNGPVMARVRGMGDLMESDQ
jgi:hypothetical protein